MKRKLFAMGVASVLIFTSCDDKDTVIETVPTEFSAELIGSIDRDTHVQGDIWLNGATIVRSGATLTIAAGSNITATDKSAYLLIERGAKIIAKGTADQPIKFTSEVKSSGSWGGLIINGHAPLSRAKESDPSNFGTEINDHISYGGSDVNDNSGELNYVVIEYSGANISDDKEHNGLTLNGVGRGTKINNIYIKDGADDGIEFFGGSVDVTNLLVVNAEDDMFDFTQGYSGKLKNAYGIWEKAFKTDEGDPRGIEADGNHDGNGATHINQSDFVIEDMTIVQQSTSALMHDVVKVRRGANATISNLLIKIAPGSPFTDVIDLTDGKGAGTATISFTLLPTDLTAVLNPADASGITQNTTSTGADVSVFAWTGYTFN